VIESIAPKNSPLPATVVNKVKVKVDEESGRINRMQNGKGCQIPIEFFKNKKRGISVPGTWSESYVPDKCYKKKKSDPLACCLK